ncbi:MAG: transposase [Chloroflexota bacterium]
MLSGNGFPLRRSLRWKGYDYTQPGAYFVTICVQGHQPMFSQVVNGEVQLNEYGQVVAECWRELPRHNPDVELDEFVVMPNHLHGVVLIRAGEAIAAAAIASPLQRQRPHGTDPGSLGAIIQSFKSVSTRKLNELRGIRGAPVWQRDYYDHVIRNDASLHEIREYIASNPLRWELDELQPHRRIPG